MTSGAPPPYACRPGPPAGACLSLLLLLFAACDPAGETGAEDPAGRDPSGGAKADEAAMVIAVTIDDLPWVGPLPPGKDRREATRQILDALRAHGVPATGFVNCGREEPGAPILRLWREAGMSLGNHTEQHLDLNVADVDAWVADARSCDAYLRDLIGEDSLYFRYPYLRRGPTEERYRAGRSALEQLGSRVAPVTINTADWLLDDPYVAALRGGGEERAEEIGDALVEHVLRATRHYADFARERLGRDIAHVLLLHANALVADRLDRLLDRLRAEGVRFVPLERALDDPVYRLPDDYLGSEGLSWLYRFEPAVPQAHAWDRREAARLRERFP